MESSEAVQTPPPVTVPKDKVLYFSFNQDCTCLSVGTSKGFKIYQCHPFELINFADIGPVHIIEMLFTTNIIALI